MNQAHSQCGDKWCTKIALPRKREMTLKTLASIAVERGWQLLPLFNNRKSRTAGDGKWTPIDPNNINGATGAAIVLGTGLVCIDLEPPLGKTHTRLLKDLAISLGARYNDVVGSWAERTARGGEHFIYRVDGGLLGGTLAAKEDNGQLFAELICNRHLATLAPTVTTDGTYTTTGGGPDQVATLTTKEHQLVREVFTRNAGESQPTIEEDKEKPWDLFNNQATLEEVAELLEDGGYHKVGQDGKGWLFTHPNSNSKEPNGHLLRPDGRPPMYVAFSPNDPFYGRDIPPSGVLFDIWARGDRPKAIRWLEDRGYKGKVPPKVDVRPVEKPKKPKKLPEYPRLPDLLHYPALALAGKTKLGYAAAASSVLPAWAASFHGQLSWSVREPGGSFSQPCVLWVCVSAPSGTRKTTLMEAPWEPHVRFQIDNAERREGLLKLAEDEDEDATTRKEARMKAHNLILHVNDLTNEAFVHLGNHVSIVNDEENMMEILGGLYSGKVSIANVLKTWDGKNIVSVRKGTGIQQTMGKISTTMFNAVQPGVITNILTADEFSERGFLARTLFVEPTGQSSDELHDYNWEHWRAKIRANLEGIIFGTKLHQNVDIPLAVHDVIQDAYTPKPEFTIETDEPDLLFRNKATSHIFRVAALLHKAGDDLETAVLKGAQIYKFHLEQLRNIWTRRGTTKEDRLGDQLVRTVMKNPGVYISQLGNHSNRLGRLGRNERAELAHQTPGVRLDGSRLFPTEGEK